MPRGRLHRWIVMGCLILAGGTIYTLPYLRQLYHEALIETLGVTNTEFGAANTAFGVMATLCYFPGGWLADRVSARKLLALSLLATGAIGLVYATIPPYPVVFVLYGLWGVTTILTFWAALVKATRTWGGAEEQGRAFGILDGGRGLVQAVLGLLALALFWRLGEGAGGLQGVLVFYSSSMILTALLVWRYIPETGEERQTLPRGQMLRVLKIPVVWLLAVVILCAYAAHVGTHDLTKFATDAFGQSQGEGAALGNFRLWLRLIGGVSAGFIADRIGASRTVIWAFVLVLVSYVFLMTMPTGPDAVWLLWVDTTAVSLAVFALRGVYYALMEEGAIPVALTGTAVGFVSVIGYTPDAALPLLSGWLLDSYPGAAGHRIFFGLLATLALLGTAAAYGIHALGERSRRAGPDG